MSRIVEKLIEEYEEKDRITYRLIKKDTEMETWMNKEENGERVQDYIKVKDNVITDVKFMTFGCGSAIATSSMATELVKGKSLDEALALTNQAVVEALDGLPPHKIHCSVLAEEAIKAAIKDYYDKHQIAYDKIKYCSGNCCGCAHKHDEDIEG